MTQSPPLILLVEDQEDLRQNLVEFLLLENYRVIGAEDGQKAYALALAHRPDLIISDVAMPVWDGPRLLAELKSNPATSDIPLLFLSAWANRDHVRRGMQLGAVDYITKPFALNEITGAIEAQLGRRRELNRRLGEAKNQERSRLLGVLPHEMLTPLNAILGPSELLFTADDKMGMDEVREWAGLIMKSATQLTRLIEKMIIYAELQQSDFRPLARSAEAGGQHHVVIEVAEDVLRSQFAEREPAEVTGVLGATQVPDHPLRRVLVELLDNAYKFSTAGSVVKVELASVAGGEEVRISNAVGGESGELTRCVASLETGGGEGSGVGLGLAIVRGLLEQHGGRLGFETADEAWLTAVVFLPCG